MPDKAHETKNIIFGLKCITGTSHFAKFFVVWSEMTEEGPAFRQLLMTAERLPVPSSQLHELFRHPTSQEAVKGGKLVLPMRFSCSW